MSSGLDICNGSYSRTHHQEITWSGGPCPFCEMLKVLEEQRTQIAHLMEELDAAQDAAQSQIDQWEGDVRSAVRKVREVTEEEGAG